MLRDSDLPVVLAALFCAACGKRQPPPATEEPTPVVTEPAAPPTTLTAVVEEAPTAPAMPPPPPGPSTCSPAHLATTGSCTDGLRCLLLLEIDATCTVKVAKELQLPDDEMEPGEGVLDVAWPKRDGSLYLVIGGETWRWGEVSNPLAAPADALTKLTWTKAKVGAIEPEGYQYGLDTDGKSVFLVGCASWDDGSDSGAEEVEEWDCKKTLFVDPKTKKKAARAPKSPFATPFAFGEVAPVIELSKRGKELVCAAGSDPPDTFYGDAPDAIVTLGPSDWLAVTYRAGSRMTAKWHADVTYYRGCSEASDLEGSIRLGPDLFWAVSTDAGWQLQYGPAKGGLSDATGKIRAFGDGPLVWTSE